MSWCFHQFSIIFSADFVFTIVDTGASESKKPIIIAKGGRVRQIIVSPFTLFGFLAKLNQKCAAISNKMFK